MIDTNERTEVAVALLVLAGVLLFGSVALGLPYSKAAGAIAVLGLAGAVLVGTAEEGRPV